MTLIVAYDPHEDESGRGYYRRLAADNSFGSWRDLAGMAGVARTPAAMLLCPDHVAAELGLEAAGTEQAAQQEQRARSWRGLRRTTSDAVCPACLNDRAYLRAYWEHSFATACPTHATCLIDRCPSCREPLSPNRPCIELCACGHDLRSIVAPPASSSQIWLSSLIASDGKSFGGVAPQFEAVSVNTLCEFVRDLCRGADLVAPSARKGASRFPSTQSAIEFLRPLDDLLAEWPGGFKSHASARIAAGRAGARTLNTLLGPWYQRLKRSCTGTPLKPFLEAVIEVASREFDGVLSLDAASKIAVTFTESLLVSDAAKSLGVSWGMLHDAVRNGRCLSSTHKLGTRSLVYHVPVKEVERIAKLRAEWISEDEACTLAHVAPAVMKLMMAAEVVESDIKWRQDILKAGPIRKSSLVSLCELLTRRSGRRDVPGEDCVSWSELTSRRMGDKRAIQAAMRAAASGELLPASRGWQLGETRFLRSDLVKYFSTPVLERGMTVQQLAERTGWKWETIGHWIDTGLLGAQQIVLRGQPCRVVLPEDLFAFRRNYLPLADLANAMGTKSSYLAEQLAGIEILGAKLGSSGARRGGLLRVADLGRLAVRGSGYERERGVVPDLRLVHQGRQERSVA